MSDEHIARLADAFSRLATMTAEAAEMRQSMSAALAKDMEILRDGQMRMAAAFEGTRVLLGAIMPVLQDILANQQRIEARLEGQQPPPEGGQAPPPTPR